MEHAHEILLLVTFLAACAHQQVSFKNDIKPIIDKRCIECHTSPGGNGYKQTGLLMYNYDDLMKGSVYGSIIVAGDSQRSVLNMLVEGRAGNVRRKLHEKGNDLTDTEIETFRLWVEQGALNN